MREREKDCVRLFWSAVVFWPCCLVGESEGSRREDEGAKHLGGAGPVTTPPTELPPLTLVHHPHHLR